MILAIAQSIELHLLSFSEFCGEENHDVGVSLENAPGSSMCDYLLESAEVEEPEGKGAEGEKKPDNEKESGKAKKESGRSNIVIFAVDISGSMSSTTTVPDLQGQFLKSRKIYSIILLFYHS